MSVKRGLQVVRAGAVLTLVFAVLVVTGCAQPSAQRLESESARVEFLPDTGTNRLILSAIAVDRLGISTVAVREEAIVFMPQVIPQDAPLYRKVIPYSAVLYDPDGRTWTYTNPEPLVFVRRRIDIDYIDGEFAFLSVPTAPPGEPLPPPALLPDSVVVTVGAAELLGIESGVGR